jgi:aminoglycoside phosphotransferase family enzyme/predicted kinase
VNVKDPDGGQRPHVVETHISTVIFVGDRALKFMKPITTPFLDQSTVDARGSACAAELELNRRIAPDVYLGVGQVIERGEIADHFLVMRRLPFDRRLSALVHAPDFPDHAREVARVVAAFHQRLPATALAAEMATRDGFGSLWAGNIDELLGLGGDTLDRRAVEEVGAAAQRYLDGHDPLFADRIARGLARDGHGDLLADDIFMLDDGPRILDCLAFDERLRCGDVLLDIAFLAMDIERLGAPQVADRLLDWYREFTNEHHPQSLAHLYVAYRALVRAKVNAMRALQVHSDSKAAEAARAFLRQCQKHLEEALPMIVLVGGAPGTGKTTLAEAVGDRLGSVVFSSDEVRKDLVGMSRFDHAYAAPDAGIYSAEAKARTYDELLARARKAVALGESVVLDASWSDARERTGARTVARELGASIVELRCELDPAIARERILARMGTENTSDATPDIADHLRAHFAPWPESSGVDTTQDRELAADAAVGLCQRARRLFSMPAI